VTVTEKEMREFIISHIKKRNDEGVALDEQLLGGAGEAGKAGGLSLFDLRRPKEWEYKVYNQEGTYVFNQDQLENAMLYVDSTADGEALREFLEQITTWLAGGGIPSSSAKSTYQIEVWQPWSSATRSTERRNKIVFRLQNNVRLDNSGNAWPSSLSVKLQVMSLPDSLSDIEARESREDTEDMAAAKTQFRKSLARTLEKAAEWGTKFANLYDVGATMTFGDNPSDARSTVWGQIFAKAGRAGVLGSERFSAEELARVAQGAPSTDDSVPQGDMRTVFATAIRDHEDTPDDMTVIDIIEDVGLSAGSGGHGGAVNLSAAFNGTSMPAGKQGRAVSNNFRTITVGGEEMSFDEVFPSRQDESVSSNSQIIGPEAAWFSSKTILENEGSSAPAEQSISIPTAAFTVPQLCSAQDDHVCRVAGDNLPAEVYDEDDPLGLYFNKVKELLERYPDVAWGGEDDPRLFFSRRGAQDSRELYRESVRAMREYRRKALRQSHETESQTLARADAAAAEQEDLDERRYAGEQLSEEDERILNRILDIRDMVIEQSSKEQLQSTEADKGGGGLFGGGGLRRSDRLGSFRGGGNADAVTNGIAQERIWKTDFEGLDESDPKTKEQIDAYWAAGKGRDVAWPGGRNYHWSAAFISFLFKNDPEFKNSIAHKRYMRDARQNRRKLDDGEDVSGKYVAYKPEEITELAPGDLLCWPRNNSGDGWDGIGYANHCDMYLGDNKSIGGNLSDRVLTPTVTNVGGVWKSGPSRATMIISKGAVSNSADQSSTEEEEEE